MIWLTCVFFPEYHRSTETQQQKFGCLGKATGRYLLLHTLLALHKPDLIYS